MEFSCIERILPVPVDARKRARRRAGPERRNGIMPVRSCSHHPKAEAVYRISAIRALSTRFRARFLDTPFNLAPIVPIELSLLGIQLPPQSREPQESARRVRIKPCERNAFADAPACDA